MSLFLEDSNCISFSPQTGVTYTLCVRKRPVHRGRYVRPREIKMLHVESTFLKFYLRKKVRNVHFLLSNSSESFLRYILYNVE